jgi:lipopolysaccharide/colanic/teichoic acid biosynthesis glycosyltransferase
LDTQEELGQGSKRVKDVLVAGLALLALSPLFAIIAIAIKLTDGGQVFFWQSRVGRHGRIFQFPKFRSMVVDAEARKDALLAENQHGQSGVTFKMKRDPRITRVGAILRRFSLDELPQLWCVLAGDMSLVGPRPAVPRETSVYLSADRRRLAVTPGLTCIWQVSGRSEISFPQQVEMDWQYIHEQSVWCDLKLLLKTIPAVLSGKGAY